MAAERKTSRTRQLLGFLLIFFGLGAVLMFGGRGCARQQPLLRPTDARIVHVKIDRWTIKAEVADSPESRRKGLSARPQLEPGYGMLFVFPEPIRVSFWMKDTLVPLSIAYLDSDGTILEIHQMAPNDLRQVYSSGPVRYALEVRQGWFAERGIQPGVKAQLPESIPPPPPPQPSVSEGS